MFAPAVRIRFRKRSRRPAMESCSPAVAGRPVITTMYVCHRCDAVDLATERSRRWGVSSMEMRHAAFAILLMAAACCAASTSNAFIRHYFGGVSALYLS
jgi:hypothetical protein